ncbi:hypothetical protein DFQ27_004897 [Actinomortierella ambigua]|uniref:Uncharacterized protein n=1 Tax=Actinomortierella ambigua TaxID=1343610 RepID=A0A9P6U3Q6_9FUNG|nr:hypothetical protein DFQ27_004897 [Actinomortierella ambigua]
MQALTPILINMLFRSDNAAQTQNQAQANGEHGPVDDTQGAGASHPNHHRRRLQQQAHRRHHSASGIPSATLGSSSSSHRPQSPLSGEYHDEKQGLPALASKNKRFSLDDRQSTFSSSSPPSSSYDHLSEKPRQRQQHHQQQQQQPLSSDNYYFHDRPSSPASRNRVMTIDMTDATATTVSSSNQLRRRSSGEKSKDSEALLIDLA